MSENTTTLTAPATAPVVAPAAKTKAPVKPRATAKPAAAKVVEPKPEVAAKAAPKPRNVVKLTAPEVKNVTPTKTAPAAAKTTTAPAKQVGDFKLKPMALVAGLAMALTDKRFKKALGYHTKTTGCLEVTADGKYALTPLGAQAWGFQRVAKNPALFTEIANFVKRGGPVPSLWKNQPPLSLDATTKMPNPIFWGSFSSAEMRLAFAALWAK